MSFETAHTQRTLQGETLYFREKKFSGSRTTCLISIISFSSSIGWTEFIEDEIKKIRECLETVLGT